MSNDNAIYGGSGYRYTSTYGNATREPSFRHVGGGVLQHKKNLGAHIRRGKTNKWESISKTELALTMAQLAAQQAAATQQVAQPE